MNTPYYAFFTNLGNPLRIKIVTLLSKKERNVTEISKELGIEQSKVSHALALLRSCNIVESKQKGKQRIYFLNKKTIVPMLKLLDKHAKTFCKNPKCRRCK